MTFYAKKHCDRITLPAFTSALTFVLQTQSCPTPLTFSIQHIFL